MMLSDKKSETELEEDSTFQHRELAVLSSLDDATDIREWYKFWVRHQKDLGAARSSFNHKFPLSVTISKEVSVAFVIECLEMFVAVKRWEV